MSDAMTRRPDDLPGDPSGGHFRVSDRERDEALELLAEAATDGRLTIDEYGDRADAALAAKTRADLTVVTRDLERRTPASPVPAAAARAEPEPERIVAIFGSEHRRGRWLLPERLSSRAVFGECKLELQEATLHSRVTVLDASAIFGSIEILVPEGVDVKMTGRSLFGSRSCDVRPAPPGAPVLEVRGRAMFGEVTVRRPGWKEGIRRVVDERLERPTRREMLD